MFEIIKIITYEPKIVQNNKNIFKKFKYKVVKDILQDVLVHHMQLQGGKLTWLVLQHTSEQHLGPNP